MVDDCRSELSLVLSSFPTSCIVDRKKRLGFFSQGALPCVQRIFWIIGTRSLRIQKRRVESGNYMDITLAVTEEVKEIYMV